MLKWPLRILGGTLVLLIVAATGLAIAYALWLPAHKRALTAGSQIASTARGEIEYAIAGDGTPILRIHGSPGGYDHSIAGPRARSEDFAGFKVIAPSRPGYLRTPLSAGRTSAEQADAYAALLDELGIERVMVWAVSGGGPSALHFAARYPQRTMGLVLVVPLLQSTSNERASLKAADKPVLLMQDFGFWLTMTLMGKRIASATMPKMMPGFDADDPLQMTLMREVGRGFIPSSLRADGRQNDIVQYRDLGIDALPLEQLTVPTLILHGTADENTPYTGSVAVARRMPRAELVTFEGGNHYIIITRAREISDRTMSFMRALVREEVREAQGPASNEE
jgi:pimeloyl-ACP methyl ester carboxylesterase